MGGLFCTNSLDIYEDNLYSHLINLLQMCSISNSKKVFHKLKYKLRLFNNQLLFNSWGILSDRFCAAVSSAAANCTILRGNQKYSCRTKTDSLLCAHSGKYWTVNFDHKNYNALQNQDLNYNADFLILKKKKKRK